MQIFTSPGGWFYLLGMSFKWHCCSWWPHVWHFLQACQQWVISTESPTCSTLHILSGGAPDITLAIYYIHIYLVNEHVFTRSFANYRKISVHRESFAVTHYYLGLPNLSAGSVSRCSLMPPPVQELLAVNVINSMSSYDLFCFPSC